MNESQLLESKFRNDEGTETLRVERNDAHQLREPNALDFEGGDIRHGLEEARKLENTVNKAEHCTREYAIERVVRHTERKGTTHYVVGRYGCTSRNYTVEPPEHLKDRFIARF